MRAFGRVSGRPLRQGGLQGLVVVPDRRHDRAVAREALALVDDVPVVGVLDRDELLEVEPVRGAKRLRTDVRMPSMVFRMLSERFGAGLGRFGGIFGGVG